MGRKCAVEECLSESSRSFDVGVTFHKIPIHRDIRPKWLSLCKIPDDKHDLKVIYICSRHFLKGDFCNFKGKKFMLKQGVLPSVFPWNRCKMERVHLKSSKSEIADINIKNEIVDDNATSKTTDDNSIKSNVLDSVDYDKKVMIKPDNLPSVSSTFNNKEEVVLSPGQSTTIEQKTKVIDTATGPITFAPNTRIEALDFNQKWSPAQIIEVDYEENEVLVHFEKYPNKYDEWICMNSNTLRALRKTETKTNEIMYAAGEKCLAFWSDNTRKFPAIIKKVIDNDTYEVQFNDGYVKVLNGCKLSKLQANQLFDPVVGTKQDRREKKRKINIAALFGKKPRHSMPNVSTSREEEKLLNITTDGNLLSPTDEMESPHWMPTWENGKPVGKSALIDMGDGPRKSVIVPDPRIPTNWIKHLVQRTYGASAGKWDCIIVSPEGRRFRTKSEVKIYIDDHPDYNLTDSMFDFSIHRSGRGKKRSSAPPPQQHPQREQSPVESKPVEEVESLKIPIVDEAYKCPIEGCGKNFRRENLAQMHVKHYHPEYTKYLDSTPNVADLAYARTVGESLDRSPGPEKTRAINKPPLKTSTPKASTSKLSQSPSFTIATTTTSTTTNSENELKVLEQLKSKDAEIIKLLNSKPFDSIKKEDGQQIQALPSGLPPSMYPDFKLKDLLMKSEGIPKQSEGNLKAITASRPGGGIKTLLPVVRKQEIKNEEEKPKVAKRKREISETLDTKLSDQERPTTPVTIKKEIKMEPAPDVIIEGGEVIKIVQMRMEEIVNCTCGITEEDGLMIQCELCLCWQHAYCNNIERENQVPEKYICYICQNPTRQRSSKKYFHDQDWLKNGTLPTASYHCKDDDVLTKRFEKLKKSHDLSGNLLELKEYLHTMRMKINIAEAKNHPKLYLWSKPWEKVPLPEKQEVESPEKKSDPESSMLMCLLKSGKEEDKIKVEPATDYPKIDLNFIDNNLEVPNMPIIPQPEAAIDSADCRINLLEHISHCQSLIEDRLQNLEEQINVIDPVGTTDENKDDEYPEIRQTTQMILRDLNTLKELSLCSNI